MSLSNMLREPRREFIEQAIGTAVVAVVVVADYFASVWVAGMDTSERVLPWELLMIILPIVLVLAGAILSGVALLIHAIGEGISDWMADREMDPRPKERGR